jgi:hypothetical protein
MQGNILSTDCELLVKANDDKSEPTQILVAENISVLHINYVNLGVMWLDLHLASRHENEVIDFIQAEMSPKWRQMEGNAVVLYLVAF